MRSDRVLNYFYPAFAVVLLSLVVVQRNDFVLKKTIYSGSIELILIALVLVCALLCESPSCTFSVAFKPPAVEDGKVYDSVHLCFLSRGARCLRWSGWSIHPDVNTGYESSSQTHVVVFEENDFAQELWALRNLVDFLDKSLSCTICRMSFTREQELYRVLRFWVDKGVAGFRLDVIDQIAKDPDRKITINGPRLHEFFRELSREALSRGGLVSVGEAWGADPERARLYSAPDGSELSMVFQFEHICLDQQSGGEKWDLAPLSLPRLKECFRRWQQELYGTGWNSLFFNNHDLPRIVSRWGDDGVYRVESAKMLATMLHGMQGTPFIYQGEELGMTNIRLELEQYQDLESLNLFRERTAQGYDPEDVMRSIRARGRDNARTPMQWTAGENAGFTTGTPWLPVNENHRFLNAEAELADPDSVFHYYRRLIALRKQYDVFRDGRFTLLCPEDPQVFAYTRDTDTAHMLVVCNFSGAEAAFSLPEAFRHAETLIANYPGRTQTLRPWEAKILYRE